MGGKIAMKLADLARVQTEKLVVLDITPIQYHESHHTEIFKALFCCAASKCCFTTLRQQKLCVNTFMKKW